MAKGGARVNSGPPPDPNALRRDRKSDTMTFFHLPLSGYEGEPPTWPLTKATTRERTLWTGLWKRPQGAAWSYFGLDLAVANYVRNQAEAEKPDANASLRGLVQRQLDSLGLTHAGMVANHWVVSGNAPQSVAPQPVRSDDDSDDDPRAQWAIIEGAAAAS